PIVVDRVRDEALLVLELHRVEGTTVGVDADEKGVLRTKLLECCVIVRHAVDSAIVESGERAPARGVEVELNDPRTARGGLPKPKPAPFPRPLGSAGPGNRWRRRSLSAGPSRDERGSGGKTTHDSTATRLDQERGRPDPRGIVVVSCGGEKRCGRPPAPSPPS